MQALPFNKTGQFYKGNLHTHSSVSDGALSPEEVCEVYQRAGYDFLAITDHFLKRFNFTIADTRPFRSDKFTTLLGAELHAGQTEAGYPWHILSVGLPLDFAAPEPDESGAEIAARALGAGAYVAAAHPAWYNLTEQDILSLGAIHAIEIFNATCGELNDLSESWHITNILLMHGHRYMVCATDDAHFLPDTSDALRAWVHVKSPALTPESLLEALKSGHYYSSTGPQIHDIQVHQGEKVTITCSPALGIYLAGKGATARKVQGIGLRSAEFSLEGFNSPYARIIIKDEQGNRAWTNPFWFD